MEGEMTSNGTAATVLAVRRWLTLEQLLEVLPLKKSYVYYLAITKQREKGCKRGDGSARKSNKRLVRREGIEPSRPLRDKGF